MLRRLVGTAVALLLVVGVALAADTKPKRGPMAFGKITAMKVKNGVGTLTILGKKSRDGEEEKMTFKITKATKFGLGKGPGKKPDPVATGKVASTFKKGMTVFISYEKKDDDMVAKMVVKVNLPKKDD